MDSLLVVLGCTCTAYFGAEFLPLLRAVRRSGREVPPGLSAVDVQTGRRLSIYSERRRVHNRRRYERRCFSSAGSHFDALF